MAPAAMPPRLMLAPMLKATDACVAVAPMPTAPPTSTTALVTVALVLRMKAVLCTAPAALTPAPPATPWAMLAA